MQAPSALGARDRRQSQRYSRLAPAPRRPDARWTARGPRRTGEPGRGQLRGAFERSPGARIYTLNLLDELARRGGASRDLAGLGALVAAALHSLLDWSAAEVHRPLRGGHCSIRAGTRMHRDDAW